MTLFYYFQKIHSLLFRFPIRSGMTVSRGRDVFAGKGRLCREGTSLPGRDVIAGNDRQSLLLLSRLGLAFFAGLLQLGRSGLEICSPLLRIEYLLVCLVYLFHPLILDSLIH